MRQARQAKGIVNIVLYDNITIYAENKIQKKHIQSREHFYFANNEYSNYLDKTK